MATLRGIDMTMTENLRTYIDRLEATLSEEFSNDEWPIKDGIKLHSLLNNTRYSMKIAIRRGQPKNFTEAYLIGLEYEQTQERGFLNFIRQAEACRVKRVLE